MKVLKKYIDLSTLGFCFSLLLVLGACKKDKQDFGYDNRKITDARKSSSVRIVNLAGYNQVLVNGDTLTNYTLRGPNDPLTGMYPGTLYFPDNGRLGTTWSIPQGFLSKGNARIFVENRSFNGFPDKLELEVKENGQQAMDYYLLPTKEGVGATGQPKFIEIPRSIAAPANPSSFKIRILNLAATVPSAQGMEDLVGPMSLTWADGTSISPKTDHILPGKYSEYIELPYTTAQLKVLTDVGIQVPSAGAGLLDPQTSTMPNPTAGFWPPISTNLTFAPIKTYAPGGVYTIVIAPRMYRVPYKDGGNGEEVSGLQNGFRIINDISEPANLTYARIQAINALSGNDGVKVLVNGKPLGTALAFTAHTDYQELIIGNYKIEAVDASGTVLASTQLKLDANTNISLWVHPDAEGKPKVSAVVNDLNGAFYTDANDDASFSFFKPELAFNIRFLNLCPDMPYLTLTTNNAQAFQSAYGFNTVAVNNLRPGIIPTVSPYIRPLFDALDYQIMAFRSTPSVVPGTWASDIPVLTGKDLIARRELYVRGGLPNHEPGFYTIALVGSTKPSAPAAQKAKMIILKHSK